MADPAPTGTVVPAPQGDGSTTPEFKVPDGKVLIDAAEQQTWARQREQLAGLTRFHGEATKRGFKSPDDFGRFDKLDGVLKGKKLTMEQLAGLLGDDATQAPEQTGALDIAAIEKQLGQKFIPADKFEAELNRRDALHEHRSAIAKEQSAIEKHLTALTGEKATDFEKAAIKSMLKDMAETKRGLYPESHILHKHELAPLDDKTLTEIVGEITKLRGLSAGAEIAQIGDDALKKGKTPTPAGSSGTTNSKPNQKPGDAMRHGGKPSEAAVLAAHEKIKARRGGGTVSSMGGG